MNENTKQVKEHKPDIFAHSHTGDHFLHGFLLPVFLVAVQLSFQLEDLTWRAKQYDQIYDSALSS